MTVFWIFILIISLAALGWNLYNLYNGIQKKVVWWQIMFACLGIIGALNGTRGSLAKLFNITSLNI
jgi:hypothetical protein